MKTCAFDGCGRRHSALGWCRTHYLQLRRYGGDASRLTPITRVSQQQGKLCDFTGCGRPSKTRGLCSSHDAQRRAGRQLAPIGPRGGRRKPASNLPDGWYTPTLPKPDPKRKKSRTGRAGSDPASLFTDAIPTVTPEQRAAVLRLLDRHDHLDLADMLGLTERAPA